MSFLGIIALAITSLLFAVIGGYIIGSQASSPTHKTHPLSPTNKKVMLRNIHHLSLKGRSALPAILAAIQNYGSFPVVVVSDHTGLVIASSGNSHAGEHLAVEASLMDSLPHRKTPWLSVVGTVADGDWVLHRYFLADRTRMCISISGHAPFIYTNDLEQAIEQVVNLMVRREYKSSAKDQAIYT